jgi:FkbM family methyltransferase
MVDRFDTWLRQRGDKWNDRSGLRRVGAAAAWASWRMLYLVRHPMARRRRLNTITTALRWEYLRRFDPRDVVVDLPFGATMECPPWSGSSRGTICLGLDDFAEQLFILDVLEPGSIALDIGAFFGTYTLPMASRGATVHAFEPAPRARRVLEGNVARNRFGDRVTVHPIALSDYTGSAQFTTDIDSGNHLAENESPRGATMVTVPVQTLDDWARGVGLTHLSLVKIDAEGADHKILAGGREVLTRFRPPIIVEYWHGGVPVRSALAALKYEVFQYDSTRRQLLPADAAPTADGNFIACYREQARQLNERLRTTATMALAAPRVHW